MAQEYIDVSTNSRYYYTSSNSVPGGSHQLLNFKSIQHLYYSNFNTGSGLIDTTGSYDNYLETSLFSGSRKLESSGEGIVYSIPQKLFGTHIEPGTLSISSSYSSAYFANGVTVVDDGEGNLIHNSTHVGNVIYTHGQLIINTPSYFHHISASEVGSNPPTISFKSNSPIYTYGYSVKISDYEMNHTLNPSAQTGNIVLDYSGSKYLQPSGKYADNVTGSAFQPYITAVGLYNDSNELIAVGKLSRPIPKPANTELTIQVNLDI